MVSAYSKAMELAGCMNLEGSVKVPSGLRMITRGERNASGAYASELHGCCITIQEGIATLERFDKWDGYCVGS